MAESFAGWIDLCKDKSPINVSQVAFPEEPSKILFALRLQGKVIDLDVGVAGADFKIKDDTGIVNCHKWCASFKDAEYIDILLHVAKYEEDAHVYGALRGTQDDKLIEVMTVNRLQEFTPSS